MFICNLYVVICNYMFISIYVFLLFLLNLMLTGCFGSGLQRDFSISLDEN